MNKLLLIILFSHVLFTSSYAQDLAKIDVRIGVLAKRGVEKALNKWQPTATYLNNYYSQYNFTVVPMGFDEIPMLVSNSLVDFVIVNSGIYVDLSVKYGINRIATLKNHLKTNIDVSKFGSVIFVKKSSTINFLKNMKDKKVAAVHHTSFGGWIMAKRELEESGIFISDFKKLDFLNTHDTVVFNVLNDKYDVGIVRTDTLERMSSENKVALNNIKVINKKEYKDFPFLASSRLYPEWPIAKLTTTDNKIAKDVVIALMNMEPNSTAAIASKIDGWTIPEDYSSVHDILKKLNISPYEEYGKITFKSILSQYWQWLILLSFSFGGLIAITFYSLKLSRSLKNEQHKLIKNEEKFRSTFDQAGIGIVHITFDGDFLRVNQQFCQLINYSCVETEKLNFSDFIHPTDLAKIVSTVNRLKNSHENTDELTIRLISSNDNDIWVVITLSKVTESSDSNTYLVATIVEISELIRLEDKINNEKLQKEMILNIAGDGILGLDSNAKHTFVNVAAAKLLGYEVEEMIGKDSHSMWHYSYENGQHFPSSKCPIASVLKDGITHRGHNEVFWKKDKKPIKVDFISTPIKENSHITGSVVIFRESNPTLGAIEPI